MLMIPFKLPLFHFLVHHNSHIVLLQRLTSLGFNVKQRTALLLMHPVQVENMELLVFLGGKSQIVLHVEVLIMTKYCV